MRDITSKSTGDTLSADEFNDIPGEIENAITATGISLTDADLTQLSKSIANYVASGSYYTDNGSVNNYVLAPIGAKDGPTSYFDGMVVRFFAANGNTSASTVNVNSLGSKAILRDDFNPVQNGDIPVNYIELTYFSFADSFIISYTHQATQTKQGKVELATDAECISGSDNTRAVTPQGLQAALNDALDGTVFPAGTRAIFYQAAAPSGWSILFAGNDRVLMVDNSNGGSSGGTWTISGLSSSNTTLSISQIPQHRHEGGTVHRTSSNSNGITSRFGSVGTSGFTGDVIGSEFITGKANYTSYEGSGSGHNHSVSQNGSWRPRYHAVIICEKD